MGGRKCLQATAALGRELETHDAVVVVISHPLQKPEVLDSVGELDGRVVLDQQVLGRLADRRPQSLAVAADRQQELVLTRRQPELGGALCAPVLERS